MALNATSMLNERCFSIIYYFDFLSVFFFCFVLLAFESMRKVSVCVCVCVSAEKGDRLKKNVEEKGKETLK